MNDTNNKKLYIIEYDIDSILINDTLSEKIYNDIDKYIDIEINYLKDKGFKFIEKKDETQLIFGFDLNLNKNKFKNIPIGFISECDSDYNKLDHSKYKYELKQKIVDKRLEAIKTVFDDMGINYSMKSDGAEYSCHVCKKDNMKCKIFTSFITNTFSKSDCTDEKHQREFKKLKKKCQDVYNELKNDILGIYNLDVDRIREIVNTHFPKIKREKQSGDLYYYSEIDKYYKPLTDDKNNSLLNGLIRKYFFHDILGNIFTLSSKDMTDLRNVLYDMVFTEFSTPVKDDYICLNNGVYDIKNKSLIEHDSDLFFINKLEIDYNPKLGYKFVEDLCNDWKIESDEFKRLLGYCFTSDYNQEKIFIMNGLGGSGKGTSMEILTQLLKGKTIGCDIEDISKGFAPTGIENATTMIDFDFDSETFYRVSVKKLNKYCDGSEIYVDRKYKQGFYINGTVKPIICTNELPNLKLNTDNLGYYRRLYIFDFKNQFKEGKNQNFNLKNLIKTDSKCRSQMLNFLISAIHLYYDRDITKPFFKNQDELKLQQQAESNPTIEYILDSFEKTSVSDEIKENYRLSWSEIIEHYNKYAESMNFSAMQKRKLKKLFKQYLHIIDNDLDRVLKINGKPTRCIMNIRFKNDDNDISKDFSEHATEM